MEKKRRLRRRTTNDSGTFLVRANPALIETLKHFAARHNRSAAEAARAAIEIYIVMAMLDALDHDPSFVAEIRAADPGLDITAFREMANNDLARLKGEAFPRPTAYHQLAPLLVADRHKAGEPIEQAFVIERAPSRSPEQIFAMEQPARSSEKQAPEGRPLPTGQSGGAGGT